MSYSLNPLDRREGPKGVLFSWNVHYAKITQLNAQESFECVNSASSSRLLWEYYFCYCEGGFEEDQIGLLQMVFEKPLSRRQKAD